MIRLYFDVHVPEPVINGVRGRGVDALTAQEDGRRRASDPALLQRSTLMGRALVTMDQDFVAEGSRHQREGIPFAGIIYAHQLHITIAQFINDLELICVAGEDDYMSNRIEWLPLR